MQLITTATAISPVHRGNRTISKDAEVDLEAGAVVVAQRFELHQIRSPEAAPPGERNQSFASLKSPVSQFQHHLNS